MNEYNKWLQTNPYEAVFSKIKGKTSNIDSPFFWYDSFIIKLNNNIGVIDFFDRQICCTLTFNPPSVFANIMLKYDDKYIYFKVELSDNMNYSISNSKLDMRYTFIKLSFLDNDKYIHDVFLQHGSGTSGLFISDASSISPINDAFCKRNKIIDTVVWTGRFPMELVHVSPKKNHFSMLFCITKVILSI